MNAAILAVGTELLGSERLDTNSLRLAGILRVYGVDLKAKSVSGDDIEEIADQLRFLMERASLIIVSGGLGPTADDVTREGVASALGRELRFEPEILSSIERRFAAFGSDMPEANRRQAYVIDGARVLANEHGSAPGLRVLEAGRTVFLFPGVSFELDEMVKSYLEPWLSENSAGERTEMRILRVSCVSESSVEDQIRPVYEEFGRENISVLSSAGDIAIELTATGSRLKCLARLEAMSGRLTDLLGRTIYSDDRFSSLEEAVARLLLDAGVTVTVAESCTGGLLAQRLTSVPGSSGYFLGGVVTYSNALKQQLLDMPLDLLERHGAVSKEVARAMAEGVRRSLGSDVGIGITGIAGPDGGTDEKPIGTVHIALADRTEVVHRALRFLGDRGRVRRLASQWGLEMMRRRLDPSGDSRREG